MGNINKMGNKETIGKKIKIRYSIILVLSFIFLIPQDSYTLITLKFLAAFSIFYFLPGIFLSKNILPQCNFISGIFLALITGICFHIVYIYFLSFFRIPFNLCVLLLPGIIFSVLADFYAVHIPTHNPKEWYLVLTGITFFLLTFTISPGEDANGHLLMVNMISENNILPVTYSLYPEIPVSYHMGFHIIVSELKYATGLTLLSETASLFGVFMIFSAYLCVRAIHTEKAALVSGVVIVFGVLPPLLYLTYGTYAIMVLFALEPLIIFLLYSTRYTSPIPMVPLVLTAAFMSHCSFILFGIVILFFLNYKMVLSLFLTAGLSIPYIARFHLSYSPQEIIQLCHLWYTPEKFHVLMILERIGILTVFCGILGIIFLKRKEVALFSVWLASLLLLAAASFFDIRFPFWFLFFANRLIDLLFIPLALLSGIFIFEIGKKYYVLLLVLPLIPYFYTGPQSNVLPPDFASDIHGITWLTENTDESAVILNDWWTGTGSSWITSLGNRRMIFPFLYINDHFFSILQIPERSRDVLWICLAPDSEESQKFLVEWDVDYIFLSSYTENRAKWRRNLWNVNKMIESPNFELVFNENETYIFKIKKEWIYTHLLFIDKVEIEKGGIDMCVSGHISQNTVCVLSYVDSFEGMVQFWSDHGFVAEISLLNTGNVKTVVLPLCDSLRMVSEHPLQVVHGEICADVSGFSIRDVVLSPEWGISEYWTLQNEGHIYGIGGKSKTLKIVYKDYSSGNVDVNCLVNGEWHSLTVIERKGDGLIKEVYIFLPECQFLDIGIKVYESPFEVISVECCDFHVELKIF
jgi:hypothetical protein